MKLTNTDIDILKILIEDRLEEMDHGLKETKQYWKPEILINIDKKLDTMYFQ